MDGYKITYIETGSSSYALANGVRSITPLVIGEETIDRAYAVTKHDRSVIWHVYDVVVVKYEKV